jgi:hypothetical protein
LTRRYIQDTKFLGFSVEEIEVAFHEEIECEAEDFPSAKT